MPTAPQPYAPFGSAGSSVSSRLKQETAGVRLTYKTLGVRRTLSKEQLHEAASTFHADDRYLSASKKLINTRDEVFKRVTRAISQARQHWWGSTIPFPVKGIRLINKSRIEDFDRAMTEFRVEMATAVTALDGHFQTLKEEARDRLGDLFNAEEYPATVNGLFDLAWDYPSVEPPDFLRQLNPELYEQERQKVAARFEAAVQMAEYPLCSCACSS